MGKTLYLECYSGISGDMTVAALLDLGADQKLLETTLGSLGVEGFSIEISRVKKAGLDVCDFSVILDSTHENFDHDMDYLHGKLHGHHSSESKQHHHRGLKEIKDIILCSRMSDRAKKTAMTVFQILAEAEAKAHGVSVDEVHFHEVGAVDSIVDVIAAAVCLDNLDITEVIIPMLWEGTGYVRCQHGIIPVPVPAVVNIAEQQHLKLKITDIEGELVTPTGAAIAAAIRTSAILPEYFTIEKTGLGAGKRQYDCPGFLRAMLIHQEDKEQQKLSGAETDEIYRLETDIDDCTGEMLGYVMEKLFSAGARDVHYTPVYMKKNRPAYELTVICGREDVESMEKIIFQETTTIGIRKSAVERTVLQRTLRKILTSLGPAEVKICVLPDGKNRCYPEYESVAAIAEKTGRSFCEVYRHIQDSWNERGEI